MLRFLLIFFMMTQVAFANLSNPRTTMETFLKSMVEVKSGSKDSKQYYNEAISTLDLSKYNITIQKTVGTKYANQLIFVLDRMEKIDYSNIPTNIEENIWIYDKRNFSGKSLEISIIKNENGWQFSQETLNSLELYHDIFKNKKIITSVKELLITDTVRNNLPPILLKTSVYLENWQWLGFIVVFMIAFIIEFIIGSLATFLVTKNFGIFKLGKSKHLVKAIKPFRRLLFVLLLFPGTQLLDLPISLLSITNRILLILTSILTVWLAHRIVDMLNYYLQTKVRRTHNKFDDILVPLATKTTFVIVYILGAIYIAYNFTIDVTGIIAGLGIGGLAFAFAAKDTLANFFGSIMLILDRPFDIGDVVVTGDIEGTVVEVGFRSTRIRTFYDSIISVSNGELVNRSIDNKGKRRYRRLNTTLGLEYDTPPEKIEAFCEGIRQIILSHKWTRKDNFNVYFVNFGASSLDIQLMVFWETPDYDREQAEKHRLMIDILRLSKQLGVNFAFPTQTLHLFNEAPKPEFKINEKYLDEGIELAKTVVAKPFSLKNPRSNLTSKEQFGSNDIGND